MKPMRLTRPEVPEAAVQSAVLEFLNYHPSVAWAYRRNVGAAHMNRPDGSTQYVRFGGPGMADVEGQMKDGRRLEIEIKARIGKTTVDQAAFIAMVRKHGGVAGVARSIEDAEAILRGEIRD